MFMQTYIRYILVFILYASLW